MDCHLTIVWYRLRFGQVQEIASFHRVNILFSMIRRGCYPCQLIFRWTHFPCLIVRPLVWRHCFISSNLEVRSASLTRWSTTSYIPSQKVYHHRWHFVSSRNRWYLASFLNSQRSQVCPKWLPQWGLWWSFIRACDNPKHFASRLFLSIYI